MADQTSTIPKNWEEATLGDAVEIIDGDRGVNYPKNNEFFSEGYCLFLNTKNVPKDSFTKVFKLVIIIVSRKKPLYYILYTIMLYN